MTNDGKERSEIERFGHRLPADRRDWLARQLVLRGWRKRDLAQEAGISPTTVGQLLAGKPVAAPILEKVAEALARVPTKPELETLYGVGA